MVKRILRSLFAVSIIAVGAIVLAIIAFSLVSSGIFPRKSALYGLLVEKFDEPIYEQNRLYPLFELASNHSDSLGSIEDEIQKLLLDGFVLEVGNGEMPGWTYIECGEYLLPTGLHRVTLRHRSNIFWYNEYFVNFTIDSDCSILSVWGTKLKPAEF